MISERVRIRVRLLSHINRTVQWYVSKWTQTTSLLKHKPSNSLCTRVRWFVFTPTQKVHIRDFFGFIRTLAVPHMYYYYWYYIILEYIYVIHYLNYTIERIHSRYSQTEAFNFYNQNFCLVVLSHKLSLNQETFQLLSYQSLWICYCTLHLS